MGWDGGCEEEEEGLAGSEYLGSGVMMEPVEKNENE